MRLFLAVWLSPELHDNAVSFIEQLKQGSAGVKWSPKEQLHFTLKFLGEHPPALLERMHLHLEEIARVAQPFVLTLGLGGVFPPRGESRVLWIGLQEGIHALVNLAEEIDEACFCCGISKEERAFKPHLTIGRVKAPPARFDMELLKQGLEGTMRVNGFAVVESRLSPSGPSYETVRSYELRG